MTPLNVVYGGTLAPLDSLPYLRVTGFKTFRACPLEWAMSFLTPEGGKESKYSRCGTAVHTMMELTLQSLVAQRSDSWHAECQRTMTAQLKDIFKEEWDATLSYQERLLDLPGEVVRLPEHIDPERSHAIEWRFFLDVPGVGKPVSGQIDALLDMPDGSLMILDHKTIREYNDAEWWARQPQPQIYAYAVRRLFPGRVVKFRIGYTNLGMDVTWTTDPSYDEVVEADMARDWRAIERYAKDGTWPARLHSKCAWCPVSGVCPEHRKARALMLHSAEEALFHEGAVDRQLEVYEAVAAVCARRIEDIKADLRARATDAGGTLAVGDVTVTVKQTNERKLPGHAAIIAIANWLSTLNPDDTSVQEAAEVVDSILTCKVTGVDKLLKKHGGLKQTLTEKMRTVPGPSRMTITRASKGNSIK